MEKFTTLITENYNIEQEVRNYVLTLTKEPESVMVECTPEELKIKFIPKFFFGFDEFSEIFLKLSEISGGYQNIGKTNINEEIFDITITK